MLLLKDVRYRSLILMLPVSEKICKFRTYLKYRKRNSYQGLKGTQGHNYTRLRLSSGTKKCLSVYVCIQVRDLETGEVRGVEMSSPAGGTKTDRNPSARILHLDPETFDLLEVETYRIDMKKIGQGSSLGQAWLVKSSRCTKTHYSI